MLQLCLKSPARLLILTGLALVFTFNFTLRPVEAQEPLGDHLIFLPALNGGKSTTPPPPPIQGAFFIQADIKTGSAAIAVDKQGGKHLAYDYYVPREPDPGEEPSDRPAAVYLYCPGGTTECAKPANWKGVAMADYVNEVQLGLTPAGQPRLLIRLSSTFVPNGNDFYYAACDQNCTIAKNWSLTYLTTNSGMAPYEYDDLITPQRSFALDSKGRPRFIYLDDTTGHEGTFYAYCDEGCSNQANWSETALHRGSAPWYEFYYYPSLDFTAQDQPRVVANGGYLLQGEPVGIYYLACDTGCHNPNNWQRVYLFDRGSENRVSWDLEMNGNRPRLAFYEGSQLGGKGDVLYYAWCDNNCLNKAGWQRRNLGLGNSNGKHPDLELDQQGRPRLAFISDTGSGVSYAWCNQGCESAQGQWQQRVVDTGTGLDQAYPLARPPHCDAGLWDALTPVLALDPAGNPSIAYDAAYHTRCWYDDPNDNHGPYLDFWQLWHSVRVSYFPQP